MTQATRDILIGLVSVIAVLGFSTLLFLFGELDPVFNPRYRVTVLMNSAGGVRPGSVVELNGVQVGVVDDVRNQLEAERGRLVRITALVQRQVAMPANVVARVDRSLIGGAATLHFVSPRTPDGLSVETLPTDGSATVSGGYEELIDQLAEAIDERIQPLARSLEGFDELTGTYNTLGRNLNDLVRPQSEDELADGAEPNLRRFIARLDVALTDVQTVFDEDFRRTLNRAEDWLADEQMRDDVRATLEQARTATENLNRTLERFQGLADELASDGEDAVQHLARAADDLSLTLEAVRRVATLASDGEGTAGQLLTNPDLYRSLDDAATRLDRVLVQLQLLLEKIRAEGLRVGG